jgi:hypothetical protein
MIKVFLPKEQRRSKHVNMLGSLRMGGTIRTMKFEGEGPSEEAFESDRAQVGLVAFQAILRLSCLYFHANPTH